jgi:hypothetical protein
MPTCETVPPFTSLVTVVGDDGPGSGEHQGERAEQFGGELPHPINLHSTS